MKVKIQYGIFGGERLGGKLRRTLKQSGYQITRSAAEADIIVAHSAGCFWLPSVPTHQKLVLIDPPYWPEKTLQERARARTKSNFLFRRYGYNYIRWLKLNAWGVYYSIRDLRRTREIIRRAEHYDLATIITNHEVLLIRNHHDDWLTPDLQKLQKLHPGLTVKQLPGDHQDWYHNPQPYVDLLQSVYGNGK